MFWYARFVALQIVVIQRKKTKYILGAALSESPKKLKISNEHARLKYILEWIRFVEKQFHCTNAHSYEQVRKKRQTY